MASELDAPLKTWLIDWQADIGGHRKTGTVRHFSYHRPTRHHAWSIARDAALAYSKKTSMAHLIVLAVDGLGRKPIFNTRNWIGFTN